MKKTKDTCIKQAWNEIEILTYLCRDLRSIETEFRTTKKHCAAQAIGHIAHQIDELSLDVTCALDEALRAPHSKKSRTFEPKGDQQ
tara:strand:- start:845 stop:1102 length:258 start_codon:yes stop_codon:yes gene_type:complete